MNHHHKCTRTRLEKWLDLEHVKGKKWSTLVRKDSRHLKLILSLKAACRSALQTKDKAEAVLHLEHDLRNAPWHALGYHANCRTSFCKVAQLLNPEEVPEAQVDFHRTPAQRKDLGSIKALVEKDWDDASLYL